MRRVFLFTKTLRVKNKPYLKNNTSSSALKANGNDPLTSGDFAFSCNAILPAHTQKIGKFSSELIAGKLLMDDC